MTQSHNLYTTKEAAEYLGIPEREIRAKLVSKSLAPDKRGGPGRPHLFSKETLDYHDDEYNPFGSDRKTDDPKWRHRRAIKAGRASMAAMTPEERRKKGRIAGLAYAAATSKEERTKRGRAGGKASWEGLTPWQRRERALRAAETTRKEREGLIPTIEASWYLGVSYDSLRARVKAGTITPDKRGCGGRAHLFSKDTLDEHASAYDPEEARRPAGRQAGLDTKKKVEHRKLEELKTKFENEKHELNKTIDALRERMERLGIENTRLNKMIVAGNKTTTDSDPVDLDATSKSFADMFSEISNLAHQDGFKRGFKLGQQNPRSKNG